jgi:hypothetical protein
MTDGQKGPYEQYQTIIRPPGQSMYAGLDPYYMPAANSSSYPTSADVVSCASCTQPCLVEDQIQMAYNIAGTPMYQVACNTECAIMLLRGAGQLRLSKTASRSGVPPSQQVATWASNTQQSIK